MGRNILITGVSSGLGKGFAEAHLDRGDRVYGCSRRTPDGLIERGAKHLAIDLSNPAADQAAFEGFVGEVRHWDVVYLNAARLGRIRDMADTPMSDLKETMEVNVWANKWMLDSIFSKAETVEVVIGISTGASRSGNRGWNGYSLSKSAFNMLMRLYANERLQSHFVSLAPGLIDSEMQDYLTTVPADGRFEFPKMLREAKGTDRMPDGRSCAEIILQQWPKILEVPSGEYADIRQLRNS